MKLRSSDGQHETTSRQLNDALLVMAELLVSFGAEVKLDCASRWMSSSGVGYGMTLAASTRIDRADNVAVMFSVVR